MTLANASKPIKPEDAGFAMAAYRRMLFIRAFEQRCLDLSTATPPVVAGSIHLCAGQEAIPTGAMAALQPQDQVVATYRGHGWALAGKLDPKEIFAEVCHRASGINGGRAGSALITAPWAGFIGENSIVGAGGPIACGVALAAQARKTGGVVLVSFGDGATSQGALHESLVFAAAYDLPVIFLCENNGWSEMTASPDIIKTDRLAKRANGYGMVGVTIDGADPIVVRDTIAQAAERARSGAGPSFVECRVSRLWGHYNRDIEHYRPKPDRAQAEANDPITLLAERLQQSGIAGEAALAERRAEADREIAAIEAAVLKEATPDIASARDYVIAEPAHSAPRAAVSSPGAGAEITYIGAVNEALRRILAEDETSLVYGEDVGKAGGIFGASRNLQREFGASRVFDTPIAEAAILGSAVGAAMAGLRPVVEIMWGDFLLVALDQIINQAANIRYVTEGRASVPMVIRTQQGATPGSCSQHSQSLEALLFHIPGIRLGLPATPQDAYDMLRVAAASPDPVMLIEARALYQRKETVFLDRTPGPMGKARLAREGRDLAIVAWGSSVPEALDAAGKLSAAGIEAAVLDLRWLSPLDEKAITELAGRCGRVLIVHEANRTGGVGAEIAARIAERHRHVVVRRLGAPDTRIPAAPVLQAALLPKADAIVTEAKALMATAR